MERAAYKVPGMVDSALLVGRCVEGLLSVWCHGFMVVEGLVETLLVTDRACSAFVCVGGNGNVVDVLGEGFPGGCCWVHGCEIEVRHCCEMLT